MPTILSLLSCSDSTRIPPYYSVFWSIRFPSVPPAVLPPTNSLSLRRSFLLPFVLSFVLLFPYSIHFKCFTIPFSWASRNHFLCISRSSRDHPVSIAYPAFFLCSLSPDHIRHLVFCFGVCLSSFSGRYYRPLFPSALSLPSVPFHLLPFHVHHLLSCRVHHLPAVTGFRRPVFGVVVGV